MSKTNTPQHKAQLHRRNKNRDRYELDAMSLAYPQLKKFIIINPAGNETVDFSQAEAVRALNTAILKHYYKIDFWEFPKSNLCPGIPGRAEYIHAVADLLAESHPEEKLRDDKITCLEIGVGATCIYPIIGVTDYDWNFIASDISQKALDSSQKIIDQNPSLKGKVKILKQKNPNHIYKGILKRNQYIDLSICNPPFHASVQAAAKSNARKVKNLGKQKDGDTKLNFSGAHTELIFEGGELQFISNMIEESNFFKKQCLWFTTLVSKDANLKKIYQRIDNFKAKERRSLEIKTGNKSSRIVAWTFLNKEERKQWSNSRWKN